MIFIIFAKPLQKGLSPSTTKKKKKNCKDLLFKISQWSRTHLKSLHHHVNHGLSFDLLNISLFSPNINSFFGNFLIIPSFAFLKLDSNDTAQVEFRKGLSDLLTLREPKLEGIVGAFNDFIIKILGLLVPFHYPSTGESRLHLCNLSLGLDSLDPLHGLPSCVFSLLEFEVSHIDSGLHDHCL